MEKRAIALLLSRQTESLGKPAFTQDGLFRMNLSWDKFNTINSVCHGNKIEIDVSQRMPKAPATRAINNEQLISGHMRIDLLKPLTKGNFILFKGDRNTGKT
jgi:hypothetical protein